MTEVQQFTHPEAEIAEARFAKVVFGIGCMLGTVLGAKVVGEIANSGLTAESAAQFLATSAVTVVSGVTSAVAHRRGQAAAAQMA